MAKKKSSPMFKRRLTRSRSAKYKLRADEEIDYKNVALLQRYLTERGKIVSRRVSGVTARQQRDITSAIKRARYLGLLSGGGSNAS